MEAVVVEAEEVPLQLAVLLEQLELLGLPVQLAQQEPLVEALVEVVEEEEQGELRQEEELRQVVEQKPVVEQQLVAEPQQEVVRKQKQKRE